MKEIFINEIMNHKIKNETPCYSNGGIYMILNIRNNKVYIGKSINYMSRLRSHITNSKTNRGILIDKEMFNNLHNFKFYLLHSYIDLKINFFNRQLETSLEQYYIKKNKCKFPLGYNVFVHKMFFDENYCESLISKLV